MGASQQRLFDYNPRPQYDPVSFARSGAQRFAAQRGRSIDHTGVVDVQTDSVQGFTDARRYADAPDYDPAAVPSYHAMARDVEEQHRYLTAPRTAGGLGVTHEVTDSDPYATPQDMAADLRDNRRIKTFSTASTGSHPVFSDEQNDKFRAVHDVFGHAAVGRTFSRHGETAALMVHRQMFSPESQDALEMETQGQNSYLNYGPTGDFGAQKIATLRSGEKPNAPSGRKPQVSQMQFEGMG